MKERKRQGQDHNAGIRSNKKLKAERKLRKMNFSTFIS
jgi:hypothetical protein